jgi:RND superfamily putative drug exporter
VLAALGRQASRRRWTVLGAWAVLLVVGALFGSQVFQRLDSGMGNRQDVESARLERQLEPVGGVGADLVVLLDGQPVSDQRLRAGVDDLVGQLRGLPDVRSVLDPAAAGPAAGLVAGDGRAQLLLVELRPGLEFADTRRVIEDVTDRAERAGAPRVLVGGPAALRTEFPAASEEQLARGELFALPLIIVLLLLAFRGVLSALLPLLVAVAAVLGSLLVLLGVSYATTLSSYAVNVITMVGLGLAVDYALLLVNRFREERSTGGGIEDAIARAAATAGRTVAYSAVTVTAALAGLLVFAEPLLRSMAWGAIGVVLLTMAAALTLIPALLGLWGHRIRPLPAPPGASGPFYRLSRLVQRFAAVLAPLLVLGLIVLAAPVREAEWGGSGPESLPPSSPTRQVAETVADRFPGGASEPVVAVVEAAAGSATAASVAARIGALPGVAAVRPRAASPPGTTVLDVVPDGPTQGPTAKRLVRALRTIDEPARVRVAGPAAALVDFQSSVGRRLPWALGVLAIATFVLLFLMTGSVVVPVKAIVMNVLSLGATFGVLVWIFQQGHLSGPLDFDPAGSIDSAVPLLIFVFAFGLSMDYEVFLLSRIKESYDEHGDSDRAVAVGLQRSGRILSYAAALMVVVFLGFAAGDVLAIKEIGIGMAVAILIDATVVRALLVPAVMKLMGRWNWWAPRPMRAVADRIAVAERTPDASRLPERV